MLTLGGPDESYDSLKQSSQEKYLDTQNSDGRYLACRMMSTSHMQEDHGRKQSPLLLWQQHQSFKLQQYFQSSYQCLTDSSRHVFIMWEVLR